MAAELVPNRRNSRRVCGGAGTGGRSNPEPDAGPRGVTLGHWRGLCMHPHGPGDPGRRCVGYAVSVPDFHPHLPHPKFCRMSLDVVGLGTWNVLNMLEPGSLGLANMNNQLMS
jgi:hypothetical protein